MGGPTLRLLSISQPRRIACANHDDIKYPGLSSSNPGRSPRQVLIIRVTSAQKANLLQGSPDAASAGYLEPRSGEKAVEQDIQLDSKCTGRRSMFPSFISLIADARSNSTMTDSVSSWCCGCLMFWTMPIGIPFLIVDVPWLCKVIPDRHQALFQASRIPSSGHQMKLPRNSQREPYGPARGSMFSCARQPAARAPDGRDCTDTH